MLNKKEYLKWQFIINRWDFSYRIGLLMTSELLIILLWMLLSYLPQHSAIRQAKIDISTLNNRTAVSILQKETILAMAHSPEVLELIKRYHQLQGNIKDVDKTIHEYKQHYINADEFSNLIYLMLSKTKNVQVKSFSTLEVNYNTTANLTSSANAGAVSSSSSLPQPQVNNSENRTQYTLSIEGNYFAILFFLKQIEKLHWQIFWDQFTYRTTAYPKAVATIEFFTTRQNHGDNIGQ